MQNNGILQTKYPDILSEYTSNDIISDFPQIDMKKYPDILSEYTPNHEEKIKKEEEMRFAQVGTNRIVNTELPIKSGTFEPINIRRNNGPLIIYDKRWYFTLVPGINKYHKRSKSLMDDHPLNNIAQHMVVCFTPDKLPEQNRPFRNNKGEQRRIYAFFDSYLEFHTYKEKFNKTDRAFYEVIFGELPQKPHFDIDIDLEEIRKTYPNENIDEIGEILKDAVITGCIQVLNENLVTLDLEKDMLVYSSHGPNKRSYHIVINNKCHDGNKEANAFYDVVVEKVKLITNNKYSEFIDHGVYSPRQQFRLIGCQKCGSNRPKVFNEQFYYQNKLYTHQYNEDVSDPTIKELAQIYESMVSFCSGCIYLPSLIPSKHINENNLDNLPDLEISVVQYCLNLLREKMESCLIPLGITRNFCPFSFNEVKGHIIVLKRDRGSFCPICRKIHQKQHPYMFIVSGKIYWHCRRSHKYADNKKLFIGYLAMTFEEIQTGATLPGLIYDNDDDDQGEFMFGDYNIGAPTLPPIVKQSPLVEKPSPKMPIINNDNIYFPPPDQRLQNIPNNLTAIQKEWYQRKYLRREREDLTGNRSLNSIKPFIQWNAGLSNK